MADPSALPLLHTVVLTPTREGVSSVTRRCVDELEQLGATRLDLAGCADVAYARNVLLTAAVELTTPERTMLLLVDDDMSFTRAQAQLLIERAEQSQHPVSGLYATNAATIAGTRRPDGRWLTGLGFTALKKDLLVNAIREMDLHKVSGGPSGTIYPFCQCGAVDGQWRSEAHWFCELMGGVDLAPGIAVGHWKRMVISPDQHTIDLLSAPEQKDEEQAAQ